MTDFTGMELNLAGSTVLFVVALLAAAALSYFVYRKTIPPVATGIRFLLTFIRTMALFIVILLLFEPIFSVTLKKKEMPAVAVLVDDSASMGLTDEKVNRAEEVKKVLRTHFLQRVPERYALEFFRFDHQLTALASPSPDSIRFNGDGTDIKRALEELKEKMAEKYFAAVVLITDGANNMGENPIRYAASYGVPIFAVPVGDPEEQRDMLISNFLTNEIVYADEKIPLDVYLKSSGFENKKIPVNLMLNNKTVDSKLVRLSGNTLEQKVRFYFTPGEEGLFKYSINLPHLEGELTYINNQKSFYVKVLKSKLKVAIVAGGPSADFSFLQRALESDKNFEIQTYVEKFNGTFYNDNALQTTEKLKASDCLILLDFPRKRSSNQTLNTLKSVLSQGKPLLFLFGKNVSKEKLWLLKDFLPFDFKVTLATERLVYLKILPQGINHPLFRISEDELEIKELWRELPPVFTNIQTIRLQPTTQTLASVDWQRSEIVHKQNLPLVFSASSGQRKSVAIAAYGLWRWDLLMWGIGKDNKTYQKFLNNTIRWLTTLEESKLVRISSNKEIYRSGEEVKFTAQVYYKDYRPVDGAEVTVQLTRNGHEQELSLANLGQGRYQGSFQIMEGGDYRYTGTAHLQGRVLGRDHGKFSVEEFNLEFKNTRMNENLLKRIAEESGGAVFNVNNLANLNDRLDFPAKVHTQKNEWEIWNKSPLLLICIFLFATEWFIRKRKGML
ncbi:MAG: hypothetical protein ACE5HO_13085 [bacterium]